MTYGVNKQCIRGKNMAVFHQNSPWNVQLKLQLLISFKLVVTQYSKILTTYIKVSIQVQ
jgi:hypothetical protein